MIDEVLRTIREDLTSLDWVAHIEAGTLGAASATRPVAPYYELVCFVATEGTPVVYTEPTALPAVLVLLEPTDGGGWLVNSFGDTPADPARR